MNKLNETISDADANNFIFAPIDYTVFIVMLIISMCIGIYFGFFDKGEDTTEEYLLGGKRMKTIPIAISLVASQLSGISIMTIPAELYAFGINWYITVISTIIFVPIIAFYVVPVFYKNNLSNCYEYLELRFDRKTRKLLTFSFVFMLILMLPVYIFIPAMALSQVTGLNVHIINVAVSSICIFYTMFGGIKAVVWTDVVQGAIMLVAVITVALLGVYRLNGFGEVFRIAKEGQRLDINYTFDTTTRSTLWNIFLSGSISWISYVGFNQSCVQRMVALPSLAQSQKAILLFGVGLLVILSFTSFSGIVMYAYYHDCDPIKSGRVGTADRLMAFFVQDIAGHLNGMSGVFISSVFSAALSTLSACLNSLSGIVYFDYIKPFIRHTESRANWIMKAFVLVMGIYCVLGGIVVANFSSIMQIIVSIGGLSMGSVFGVFTLGMLVPRAHGRAAFYATVISLLTMFIVIVGAYGRMSYVALPVSTESCERSLNISTIETTALPLSTVAADITISTAQITTLAPLRPTTPTSGFNIFEISFNWYVTLGAVIVFLIGVPLSYLIEPTEDHKLDPKLLFSFMQPPQAREYHLTQTTEMSEFQHNGKEAKNNSQLVL